MLLQIFAQFQKLFYVGNILDLANWETILTRPNSLFSQIK